MKIFLKKIAAMIITFHRGWRPAYIRYLFPNVERSSIIHKSAISRTTGIGSGTFIWNSDISRDVSIAEHCKIRGCKITGKVTVGKRTSLWGPDISIYGVVNGVDIGRYCSVGQGVLIYEYNHKTHSPSSYFVNQNIFSGSMRDDITSKGKVSIGNDVWIGARAIVLSGISVGDGAIIGAGSVVAHDILPYSIVAGNPAKVIGYRFEQVVVDALLILKWWDYPEKIIRQNKDFFNSPVTIDQVERFVK